MKASFILAIPALALTASAEPIPRIRRDDAVSLSSVADRISDAMVRLDEDVKPFGDDAVPVLRSVRLLIETIENSTKQVNEMQTPVPVNDITNMQQLLTTLETSGKALLNDVSQKKSEVEKSRICGPAMAQMIYVDTLSRRLIDAALRKLPQPAHDILKSKTEGLSQIIRQSATIFGPYECKNLVVDPSAPALPTDGDNSFPTVNAPPPAAPAPTDSDTFPTVAPAAKRVELPEAGDSYVAEPIPTTSCTEEEVPVEPTLTVSTTQTRASTATISLSTTVSTATVYPTTTSSEVVTVPTTLTSIDTTECDEETVAPSTTGPPEVTVPTTLTSIDTTECDEETVAPSTTSPPEATTVPTTVTSIDTTECEEETTVPNPPSSPEYPTEAPSKEPPPPTESSDVPDEPSTPPYPTGDFNPPPVQNTTQVFPTGGYPTASTTAPPTPIVTAAAAGIHAPVGLAAALAAAMFMF